MLQYLWLPLWILNTDISYYFIYDFFFINGDTEDNFREGNFIKK